MLLTPDFLRFQHDLRMRRDGATTFVFDPIRRKEVVCTPEELLRQLVLRYLLDEKKYPSHRIRVELGLTLNGMPRRSDIVVYDKAINPWLVIECKSPKVVLTQSTFEQAAKYNMQFRAPFLCITNGMATFCCALDFEQGTFRYLDDFPPFGG